MVTAVPKDSRVIESDYERVEALGPDSGARAADGVLWDAQTK